MIDLFATKGIDLRDRPPQAGTKVSSGGHTTPAVTVALTDDEALSLTSAGGLRPEDELVADLSVFLGEHGVRLGVTKRTQPAWIALINMYERDIECLEEAFAP